MKKPILLAAASVASFVLSACAGEHHAPEHEELPPPASVRAMVVDAASLQGAEEAVGTVRAVLHATLEAKVSGRISKLPVKLGDRVRRGELIANLEVAEVEAKLAQAEAVYEQARADRDRYEALLAKSAVTQQKYEQVAAQFQVAAANVREARSILDYARVRAPFDGVITQRMADVGDLSTPGRPLVRIEDPSRHRLEVSVSEALSRFVGVGSTIPVEISAIGERFDATVAEIAPSADPNSRTLLVKLDLPQQDGLKSGQFGRAFVPTGRTEVIQLPRGAVVRRGQLEIVFVVNGEHAEMRLVKTGKHVGDRVEVVSGLEPGESVVTEGASTLVDGQPLEVRS